MLPIGMTLRAVGCWPFPYQSPSRCPVDRTFGCYHREPQLFGLGREPIKTEIGWIAACRFLRSEGTGRRQRALLQRQKQFRDRLMLRHLREEAQPLAIDREVACFLAAGRKPVAIKVERGGLQIVGVANDAQHCAASAGNLANLYLAGFDLLADRLDRLV